MKVKIPSMPLDMAAKCFYVVKKQIVQRKDGVEYIRYRRVKIRKVRLSKRYRPGWKDTLKPGISDHPPGKGRVADLARWYSEHPGESPFDI